MGRRHPDDLRTRPLVHQGQIHRHRPSRVPRRAAAGQPVFLVTVHLPGTWAWRIPFLLSIVLVIVGLIIRSKIPESPVFEEVKARAVRSRPGTSAGSEQLAGAVRRLASGN